MTDVSADTKPRPGGRRDGLNLWLNLAVAFLILSILGAAVWFGYSVYRDRQSNLASSAAGRLVGVLTVQVRKNPNDVVLRVRLGEALGGMGKFREANEQLTAALKLDPKHVGAHLDLGLVSLGAKNLTAAESYFKKVLELTEDSQYAALSEPREIALYNLGQIALEKKRYDEAAGFFKAAIAIRKDASDSYYQLAKALQGMGEIDGAIQQLEIGIQFDPGFGEAHFLLGELYKLKNDEVNASSEFVRAMELAPDADEPREAVEAYGPAGKWTEKATTALAAGDVEGALNAVLVARNLDKQDFDAAKLHAEILIKRANLKDALDVYREAAKLDPKNAEVKAQIAALEPQVAALIKAQAPKPKAKK
jgi:tetratricopeptide (TPR) repeat protein